MQNARSGTDPEDEPRDHIESGLASPSALQGNTELALSSKHSTDNLFLKIAESANDVIIVTTPDLDSPGPTILYVNPAFTRLTGYSADEAIGHSPRMLQGPGTDQAALRAIGSALRAGREAHEKILNFGKNGGRYWLDLRIVPLRAPNGAVTYFAAIERDVTLDKRKIDALQFVADRDPLTGIPNRRALLRVIRADIEADLVKRSVSPNAQGPCLAFVDVDHFKKINDTFGHPAGDAVLLGIADRLTENVRRSDMVGRMGGEEFAVWMPAVALAEATNFAERLCRSVWEAPFDTPKGAVEASVSIGVAAHHKGDDLAYMVARADNAMYAAKRAGRNRVSAATEGLPASAAGALQSLLTVKPPVR